MPRGHKSTGELNTISAGILFAIFSNLFENVEHYRLSEKQRIIDRTNL